MDACTHTKYKITHTQAQQTKDKTAETLKSAAQTAKETYEEAKDYVKGKSEQAKEQVRQFRKNESSLFLFRNRKTNTKHKTHTERRRQGPCRACQCGTQEGEGPSAARNPSWIVKTHRKKKKVEDKKTQKDRRREDNEKRM